MILTLDIGNTNIKTALFEGMEMRQYWRISTDRQRSSDELGLLLMNLLQYNHIDRGQIDGIMIDLVVANAKIKNLGDDSLKIIDTFEDDLYAIGFRKDDLALRDKVNEILEEMAADGTLATISQTWFGEDISLVGKQAD